MESHRPETAWNVIDTHQPSCWLLTMRINLRWEGCDSRADVLQIMLLVGRSGHYSTGNRLEFRPKSGRLSENMQSNTPNAPVSTLDLIPTYLSTSIDCTSLPCDPLASFARSWVSAYRPRLVSRYFSWYWLVFLLASWNASGTPQVPPLVIYMQKHLRKTRIGKFIPWTDRQQHGHRGRVYCCCYVVTPLGRYGGSKVCHSQAADVSDAIVGNTYLGCKYSTQLPWPLWALLGAVTPAKSDW